MTRDRNRLANPAQRLPELSLPSATSGEEISLRSRGRRSTLLLLVHGAECAACNDFASLLEAQAKTIGEWDGRLLVVVPETAEMAAGFSSSGGAILLADPDRRLNAAISVPPPALVIADQWGEVHETWTAGEKHVFPALPEIIGTLRYLAIRCPECEGEAL